MAINSVYLSGWEYNRLLGNDPTAPRNSALPAEVLWNGAAEFWMFEKVYCTKESLDCERSCFKVLEWPTGRAFVELASRGFLVPVDWSALDTDTTALLRNGYTGKRSSKNEVRTSIREGKTGQLEALKIELLAPLLSILPRYELGPIVEPDRVGDSISDVLS